MTNETTASQPKSIGDDAQFHDAMMHFLTHATTAKLLRKQPEYLAIASMFDSRAPSAQASAAIQAAPEGDIRVLRRWATQIDRMASTFSDERSLLCQQAAILLYRIAYLPDAATIQEPVMVAEPVGEVVLFGGDLKEVSWAKGKMPAPGTKLYAAPMVADPAGVATFESVLLAGDHGKINDATIKEAMLAEIDAYRKAATVKAVPSEALCLRCAMSGEVTKCGHQIAAPLADKTGGGE